MSERVSNSEMYTGQFSLDRIRQDLEVIEKQYQLNRDIDEAILQATFNPGDKVLDLIVEKALATTKASHCHIVVNHRNTLQFLASSETKIKDTEHELTGTLCAIAFYESKDQHVFDVNQLPSDRYRRLHSKTNSELVKLIRPENSERIIGMLVLESELMGGFNNLDLATASILANKAALIISENRIWSIIEALQQVSSSLLSGFIQPEEAYQKQLDTLLNALRFQHGQFLRLINDQLQIVASSTRSDVGLRLSSNNSIIGQYLLGEKQLSTLNISDIVSSTYSSFYLPLLGSMENVVMSSELIVPLKKNGNLVGAINLESTQENAFSAFDEKIIELAGSLLTDALIGTYSRVNQINQERINTANLALSHLGSVAQNFLHRFGNKLGDVRGRLFELRGHLQDVELPTIRQGSVDDFLFTMTENIDDMVEIVNDFRLRFNPDMTVTKSMDLMTVAEESFARFVDRCKEENIEIGIEKKLPLEYQGRLSTFECICDLTDQISEVIDNLIDNAIEAIKQRKSKLGVEVENDYVGYIKLNTDVTNPHNFILTIEDNGIGIKKEDEKNILKFGYTTKKRIRPFGGIGLWYCHLYAQSYGGDLAFHSTYKKGTCFTLKLPVVR